MVGLQSHPILIVSALIASSNLDDSFALQPMPSRLNNLSTGNFIVAGCNYSHRRKSCRNIRQISTTSFAGIGSRGDDRDPPSGGGRNNDDNPLNNFLDPSYQESENLRRARELISENALPLNYDSQIEKNGSDSNDNDSVQSSTGDVESGGGTASAIIRTESVAMTPFGVELTPEAIANNPYIAVVSELTPSEIISKFTSTAHPRVQNAVRTTILGMIGGLPKWAFETSVVTTGQKLASLMFQLQMTGYMFKNAEYRLSVQQSLGLDDFSVSDSNIKLLPKSGQGPSPNEKGPIDPLAGKVRGKIRIKYKGLALDLDSSDNNENETENGPSAAIEVDAAAYMSELRSEVAKLRDELVLVQKKRDDEDLNKDLLTFIRTLPPQQLKSLTNTISSDVLVAMKGLVNAVMAGIGGEEGPIQPDFVTEQSAEAMAQLCMWQLVIGYNLRTLEVREEMKKSLLGNAGNTITGGVDDFEGGVDFSQPGAME